MRQPLVLVADDLQDCLEILVEFLNQSGFRTVSADSGPNALELAASSAPDAIVLDVTLPGLDGLEVTRELRRREPTRATPIILLTGHAREAAQQAGRAAGCDAFFTKPYEPEVLVAEIRRLLAHRPPRRPSGKAAPIADASSSDADAREQLVSVLAHDLRDPLSVIHVRSELLLRDTAAGSSERKYIEAIRRAAEEIDDRLHDLVDAARIGSGRVPLVRESFEAAPLIEEAVARVLPVATRKSVRLQTDGRAGSLLGDRARLLQAFQKLFETAVRFSPSGATVTLRAARSNGKVRFTLSDSMQRMPEEPDAIDVQGRRPRPNYGLAMFVARDIVQAHGGELTIEGRPGRGTTFCFTLRAAAGLGVLRKSRVSAAGRSSAAIRAGSTAPRRA